MVPMTKATKPTTRLSFSTYRGREIVVTIHPTWLEFRLKRTKQAFQMDIQAAYQRAVMAQVEKIRAEKKKAKTAAKKVKR